MKDNFASLAKIKYGRSIIVEKSACKRSAFVIYTKLIIAFARELKKKWLKKL